MKSLPPLIWILGGFGILAMVVFAYGRLGPDPLPPPRSAWDEVRVLKAEIEDRSRIMAIGERQKLARGPYVITVERLVDLLLPEAVGRYVFWVKPAMTTRDTPMVRDRELAVAWFDRTPESPLGQLQVAAIRRPKVSQDD